MLCYLLCKALNFCIVKLVYFMFVFFLSFFLYLLLYYDALQVYVLSILGESTHPSII